MSDSHDARREWRLDLQEVKNNASALTGATLGAAVGMSAMFFYTSGVFIAAMGETLGWTRSQFSFVHLLHSTAIAACAPLIGAILDRGYARIVIACAFLAEVVIFGALAAAPADFTVFLILQLALAIFGMGSTPIAFSRIATERFERRRGFALACVISGMGVTALIAPPVIARIVHDSGWRMGYAALAATLAVMGPLSWWLIFRRAPARVATTPAKKRSFSRQELAPLLSRPLLWMLIGCFCLAAASSTGYVPHLIRMLSESGIAPVRAAEIQGLLGLAVLTGRFGIGLIVDKVHAPLLGFVCLVTTAVGLLGLSTGDVALVLPAVFALGFTLGAELDLMGYLIARYFGVENFGKLYGLLYGCVILSSGTSPLIIATIADRTGGYSSALQVSAVGLSVAAVLLLLLPRFPTPGDAAKSGEPASASSTS